VLFRSSLKQLLPIDTAKRLTMTGEVFDGTRAVELGLASEVAEDPAEAARALAEEVATRSPDSVAYAKRIIDETWTAGPRRTFFMERARQARLLVAKNTKTAQTAAAKARGAAVDARSTRREVRSPRYVTGSRESSSGRTLSAQPSRISAGAFPCARASRTLSGSATAPPSD